MNRYTRFRRLIPTASLVLSLCALLFAGCNGWDTHQSALDPKGPVAQNQYDAFMVTLWVTTFLWVTVGGALLFAVWRFRLKKGDDPNVIPKQSHGHPLVEVGLIAFSALCLLVIAVPTLKGIVFMHKMPEHYEEGAIEINATGYQWWWQFDYPTEGFDTANEIVIPVGRAVKMKLNSADVIHSFWLPKLAGKVDLVPGQENFIWFLADEEGYYYGQCAEYCGDSHAYMLFRVHVVSEEAYAEWLDHQREPAVVPLSGEVVAQEGAHANWSQVVAGRDTFLQNCSSCHQIGGEGGVTGPDLTHFASRSTLAAGWLENNPENLYRWIRQPDSVKPGNYMWKGVPLAGTGMVMEGLQHKNLSDEDVHALVAYLSLLK